MIKYFPVCTMFLMSVFHSICGQSQTNVKQDNVSKGLYTESRLKEAVSSGVPMSMVRNVRQAKNGDILIASYLGVFRYDGKTFTNITSEISAPRVSSFWDVLEDRKGNLWFASRDSGVYYYNARLNNGAGQTKTFQHFTTKDGLADNRIVKIYEDKAGNIWFATGGGVSRYDVRPNDSVGQGISFRNITTKEGLSNNDLTTIMEDKTGRLWFGTRGEACYYDGPLNDEPGQGKTFTVFKNNDGKAFHNIWSIIEDNKGNIWFSDVDGFWRYDGSTFTKVSDSKAYAIMQDKKGNIWTTGEVNPQLWALSRYDAKSLYEKTPTVTEIKSGGPGFLGMLEANDGSIWFGSMGLETGVYRYDGKTITAFRKKEDQK